MIKEQNRKLIFEDGSEYLGYGFGSDCEKVLEAVFNTSMVGYQEILSSSSSAGKAVILTYPLIGNYGMCDEDYESDNRPLGALICGSYNDVPSNFRATKTLAEVMKENDIPGVYGLDTRKITNAIRDNGCMKVLITSPSTSKEEGLKKISETNLKEDLSKDLGVKEITKLKKKGKLSVAVLDLGVNNSILNALAERDCAVTLMPYTATLKDIEKVKPNGILISNGTGNPTAYPEMIGLIRQLKGKYPIFAIDLGYELLCLSYGAKTYKLKAGHRGSNHPIKSVADGKVDTMAQNHSYAVDKTSLEGTDLTITHLNVLDGTVEGVECAKEKAFGLQFMPDTSSTKNITYTESNFDKFVKIMKGGKR